MFQVKIIHRIDTMCLRMCVNLLKRLNCKQHFYTYTYLVHVIVAWIHTDTLRCCKMCHWELDREWKFEPLASLHCISWLLMPSSMCYFVFKSKSFSSLQCQLKSILTFICWIFSSSLLNRTHFSLFFSLFLFAINCSCCFVALLDGERFIR